MNAEIIDSPTVNDSINRPSSELSYKDFIVYSHAFNCLNNHSTEMINAVVKIVDRKGNIIEKTVRASYCATCDKYIILNADYKLLCTYGILLCRQQSFEQFIEAESSGSGYKDWKPMSDLRLLGYTVNAKDNLSEEQRHTILCKALESGLYTIDSLRSFLLLLVENNEYKPNYSLAVSRWKRDINYLENYESNLRNVGVKSITKTTYYKR